MNKVLITLAALAVGLVGCGSMGSAGGDGIVVLASGNHSSVMDPDLKDFHNAADLKAYMDKAFEKQGGAPDLGVIDWNKQMVLALFAGAKKNTGFRLRFLKVDSSGDTVIVQSRVVIPCHSQSTPDESQPYLIIAAPATSKPVSFADPEQEYAKC